MPRVYARPVLQPVPFIIDGTAYLTTAEGGFIRQYPTLPQAKLSARNMTRVVDIIVVVWGLHHSANPSVVSRGYSAWQEEARYWKGVQQ